MLLAQHLPQLHLAYPEGTSPKERRLALLEQQLELREQELLGSQQQQQELQREEDELRELGFQQLQEFQNRGTPQLSRDC